MGLSLVIKSADFSANSVGNAFFPFFANLVGAEFYGNLIPNLSGNKKTKGSPVLAGGSGVIAFDNYALIPANAQILKTGLIVPPTFTVIAVANKSGTTSTAGHDYMGTEPAGGSPFQGNFTAAISCFGATSQSRSATYATVAPWHALPSPSVTSFNFVQAVTVDSVALKMTDTLMYRGGVGSSSAAITQQSVSRNLNVFGSSDGVLRMRSLAVFNRVLTQAEMLVVHAWLKTFYAGKGVEV